MRSSTINFAPGALPVPSDSLRPLRSLLAFDGSLAQVAGAFQIRLIVDANQVLADIRWLVRRETPGVRTTLQEVIAAGTAVVYAPEWIDTEVRTNAPRMAREAGVSEELFLETWEEYRQGLILVGPTQTHETGERRDVVDPKDLPYVDLCFEVGAAAVYSENERHLTAMGVPVVKKAFVSDLRTYSRGAAVSLTVTVGGSAAVVVSAKSVHALVRWVYGLVKRLAGLPAEVKFLALLAGVVVLVHPGARAWAARKLERVPAALLQLFQTIGPGACRVLVEAFEAQENARVALESARGRLPKTPRHRLRNHIVGVLVAAGRPLTPQEIIRHLRAAGCRARSDRAKVYVARSLAADDRFISAGAGRWTVRPAGAVTPPTSAATAKACQRN